MEVPSSQWISKAIKKVDLYVNRGGDLKGDKPQILGGADLLNTIGVAMGLPASDPKYWTRSEMQSALKGKLVYFEGDARKTINVIAEQIIRRCDGDEKNYVTVLPIELYRDGVLSEVPLFRVQRFMSSKIYYVDNIGRFYDSVSDWYSHNKLPPCKMAYPYDLRLMLRPGYKYARVLVADTPSARDGAQIRGIVDNMFAVVGIGSSIGLMFASGGAATPFVGAGLASTFWKTARTSFAIADRAVHGESLNPITNAKSRLLWLNITESIFVLSSKAATKKLLMRGSEASTSSRQFVDTMNKSSIVVRGINKVEATRYLIRNYDEFSRLGILMHVISIAFWTKDTYNFKSVDALIAGLNE